jgi:glucose-6-phosphate 1-dehydrogenase
LSRTKNQKFWLTSRARPFSQVGAFNFPVRELPAALDADAIRDEKVKTMRAVRPLTPAETGTRTVRAQYDGYCATDGVAADSRTATYAAVELYIDNWRWHGIPFYLRAGKALAAKVSEIIIQFKEPPHTMFTISDFTAVTEGEGDRSRLPRSNSRQSCCNG